MASYRVEMDRTMCISCGNCIESCPDIWEFADDGISSIKDPDSNGDVQIKYLDNLLCSVDAAERCPVLCIHVFEDDNELV
ncbi:ferredoxin [Methanobacterium alcaliphilum]|uniref:ferredoxin n=1 Tax=Methanobacterium alcaliphilum TaxID=392018 RepID=UPI00200B9C97|nr:ferredoxin [Methanobacterium alcaliphilum]MCK9151205.1 ferredoxin [Methanobacterium alcaliphilum]